MPFLLSDRVPPNHLPSWMWSVCWLWPCFVKFLPVHQWAAPRLMPRLITMEVSRLLVNSLGDADVYWECNGCHPGLSEDVVITASKVAFMANGFVPDGAERNPENLCPLRCERRGQPFTPAK